MERPRRGLRRWRVLLALAGFTLATVILVGWRAVSHAHAPASDIPCNTNARDTYVPWERTEQVIALPERDDLLWLCLGYDMLFAGYGVVVPEVTTRAEFQAARATAAVHLQATGVDPCDVLLWSTDIRKLSLDFEAWFESPVTCPPRLLPLDSRAAAWLPAIRTGVERIVAATEALTDVRPARRLTVALASDADSAILAYERYVLPLHHPDGRRDQAAFFKPLASRGGSIYVSQSVFGSMLLVNLNLHRNLFLDPTPASMPAAFDRVIAHEHAHFVQHAAGHYGYRPAWFAEGQARVVERIVGLRGGYEFLVDAADERRNGKAPSLRELNQRSAASRDGQTDHDVYAHGHATVAYLADQHGFDATMHLLQANRFGNERSFDHHLSVLTGLSIDELDAAVGDWLLAPGRVLFREDFSRPSRYTFRRSDEKVQQEQIEGEYAVTKLARSGQAAMATLVAPLGDFQATVEARFVAPIAGATLDLEMILPRSPSAYTYRVDPQARAFALERKARDVAGEIAIDWTPAPAIRSDEAPQRFGVHTREGAITLLANDEVIGRVAVDPDDSAPSMGALTLRVGHRADGHAEVRFRSLVVANAE